MKTNINSVLPPHQAQLRQSERVSFTDYLQSKGFTFRTITSFERVARLFLSWLKQEQLKVEHARYQDILQFMKHCQRRVSQRTVQLYLNVITHYYHYLISIHQAQVNPASGIKVQGIKRKTLYHIFLPEELHALYNSYQDDTLKGKRNKIMLSLLVYQGVKTQELIKMQVQDVKLKAGEIEIPAGTKGERRVLQLESHQVLAFYDYVNNTRKEILAKSAQQTDRLFVSVAGGDDLHNYMTGLMVRLRKQNKLLVNAKQLRASVIVKWLKMYNLRKVQYMAGHRFISSTESYQQSEMEGLTEQINKFHPLG
jgi:site-specific recombinase XerD